MVIAIDMDDTIENLLPTWVDTLNTLYSYKNYPKVNWKNIYEWDMKKAFPYLTNEQIYAPLDTKEFWKYVKPKTDAVVYVNKLIGDGNKIVIVTASGFKSIDSKMENCLFKYFPYLSSKDVIITKQKGLINCDIIIDDYIKNINESRARYKILFGTNYNTKEQLNDNTVRLTNWKDIYNYINNLGV